MRRNESWRILKNIAIVEERQSHRVKGLVPNGYVVDRDNIQMLETAVGWAIQFSGTKQPTIHALDNKGFKLKINSNSLQKSYNGGRLTMVACEVTKDSLKFMVGISASMLFELLGQSTCTNGEIREELMFARDGGDLGLVHEGMIQYGNAVLEDNKGRKDDGKNVQLMVGASYVSNLYQNILLGYTYSKLKVEQNAGVKYKQIAVDVTKTAEKHFLFPTLKEIDLNGQKIQCIDQQIMDIDTTSQLWEHIHRVVKPDMKPERNLTVYKWYLQCLTGDVEPVKRIHGRKLGSYRLRDDSSQDEINDCLLTLRRTMMNLALGNVRELMKQDLMVYLRMVFTSPTGEFIGLSEIEQAIMRFLVRLNGKEYIIGPEIQRMIRMNPREVEDLANNELSILTDNFQRKTIISLNEDLKQAM